MPKMKRADHSATPTRQSARTSAMVDAGGLSCWFFVGLAPTRTCCFPVFGNELFTDCSRIVHGATRRPSELLPQILNEPKSLYQSPSGALGFDSRQTLSWYRSSAVIL